MALFSVALTFDPAAFGDDLPGKLISHDEDAVSRAMSAEEEAAQRARNDPKRPIYHFLAPANWMNDPNGPIYFHGYYHIFYQHNPYGDDWGNMHWGHARSRDLVHWEHLPVALWPSKEAGEEHVFSGCATVNGSGRPMIFYTSIGRGKSATDYAEQWSATSDDSDLVKWQKHPANPILTEKLHGDVKVYDWRDPFIFNEAGRTFLVCGGNLNHGAGGAAVVNLYETADKGLTQWKYLGVLFTHPDPKVANIECPNFFKLGERWVLVVSPHRKVEYFIGTFDLASHQFKSERDGVMDYGNYYAPNCLFDPKGRRIMWGWVNGFQKGLGWNGCLTLPRILTIGADGQLLQSPAPELRKLRGKRFEKSYLQLNNSTIRLAEASGDVLEIVAEIEPQNAKKIGLKLRRSPDGAQSVVISYDGSNLDVAGVKAPFKLAANEKLVKLRVFLDKSVMEVFANDRVCCTRVLEAAPENQGIELFAEGGPAVFRSFQEWPMRSGLSAAEAKGTQVQ